MQFIQNHTTRWFEPFILACHAAEDVSEIPLFAEDKSHFTLAPPKVGLRLREGNGCLFFDELTCSKSDVRAAALTMLSGRMMGDLKIHDDIWMVSAWNPIELAPNATPLEKSVSNRFAHFKWVHDYPAWEAGLLTEERSWGESFIPVAPKDWGRHGPDMGGLITGYLRKNPNDRIHKKPGEEIMAFATPRSWDWLRDGLAVAQAVNAPANIQREIACALVGDVTGKMFMQYVSQRDLVDPEEVLSGGKKFKHDPKRTDLTLTLLTSVVTCIRQRYSAERMDAAVELFCRNIAKDSVALVLTQLRHLANSRPEGTTLSKASLAAMSEFGTMVKGITSK